MPDWEGVALEPLAQPSAASPPLDLAASLLGTSWVVFPAAGRTWFCASLRFWGFKLHRWQSQGFLQPVNANQCCKRIASDSMRSSIFLAHPAPGSYFTKKAARVVFVWRRGGGFLLRVLHAPRAVPAGPAAPGRQLLRPHGVAGRAAWGNRGGCADPHPPGGCVLPALEDTAKKKSTGTTATTDRTRNRKQGNWPTHAPKSAAPKCPWAFGSAKMVAKAARCWILPLVAILLRIASQMTNYGMFR